MAAPGDPGAARSLRGAPGSPGLEAVQVALDLAESREGLESTLSKIPFGFANPRLHFRVIEPELIVRDEACRDQLKRSSIGSFENQKVPGFEPKLCADFLGKRRPALLVKADDG